MVKRPKCTFQQNIPQKLMALEILVKFVKKVYQIRKTSPMHIVSCPFMQNLVFTNSQWVEQTSNTGFFQRTTAEELSVALFLTFLSFS